MSRRCHNCRQPAVRGTMLCEAHYQGAMDDVAEYLRAPGKRPDRQPISPAVTTTYVEPTKPKIERLPRNVRAERIARAVRASDDGWISREQAAEAAGVALSGLPRILRYGSNAGWLQMRVPKPGIWIGPVEPPAEDQPDGDARRPELVRTA